MSSLPRLLRFEASRFGVFRAGFDVAFENDVTVIVGRNDTGKTTILEALQVYSELTTEKRLAAVLRDDDLSGGHPEPVELKATWQVGEQQVVHSFLLDASAPQETLEIGGQRWVWWAKKCVLDTPAGKREAKDLGRLQSLGGIDEKDWKLETEVPEEEFRPLLVIRQFHVSAAYLLNPGALEAPTALESEGKPFPWPSGYGWAVRLQALLNQRDSSLDAVERRMRDLFPFFRKATVQEDRVDVVRTTVGGLPVEALAHLGGQRASHGMTAELARQESRRRVLVSFANGDTEPERWVPAAEVSSGLLLALAHLTLASSEPEGGCLLLEEPENGLNSGITFELIEELYRVVKERKLQLVLTTHNGWWLDVVAPESIRVTSRDVTGAHVRRPGPGAIRRLRERKQAYPSEIMGALGPEALLDEGDE